MRYSVVVAALLSLHIFSHTAHARTWYVLPDGTGDAPTIQAGIDSATWEDTVLVACGTYFEHDIMIKDIGYGFCVRSETADASCVTIDAQGLGRVFHCDSTYVSLEYLTITNGQANEGGGVYGRDSQLILRGCVISDNQAPGGKGGGMYGMSTSYHEPSGIGSITIDSCTFLRNQALSGGGLAGATESYIVKNTVFQSNVATYDGGGLFIREVEVRDCLFSGNMAQNGGGMSVLFSMYQDTPIIRCTFSSNTALEDGGGLYVGWGSSAPVDECIFYGNSADGEGAGVFAEEQLGFGSCRISNTVIAHSVQGEAVACGGGSGGGISCSDLFANAGGDWVGCVAGLDTVQGNFSLDPLFCNPAVGDFTLDAASPCLNAPGCGQVGAHGQGCNVATAISTGEEPAPMAFSLHQNTPNPFNPTTTIRFDLPQEEKIRLAIYDVAGRLVTTLVDGPQKAGQFSYTWDGRDDAGQAVRSSIYFARLEAGEYVAVRKMVLLR